MAKEQKKRRPKKYSPPKEKRSRISQYAFNFVSHSVLNGMSFCKVGPPKRHSNAHGQLDTIAWLILSKRKNRFQKIYETISMYSLPCGDIINIVYSTIYVEFFYGGDWKKWKDFLFETIAKINKKEKLSKNDQEFILGVYLGLIWSCWLVWRQGSELYTEENPPKAKEKKEAMATIEEMFVDLVCLPVKVDEKYKKIFAEALPSALANARGAIRYKRVVKAIARRMVFSGTELTGDHTHQYRVQSSSLGEPILQHFANLFFQSFPPDGQLLAMSYFSEKDLISPRRGDMPKLGEFVKKSLKWKKNE